MNQPKLQNSNGELTEPSKSLRILIYFLYALGPLTGNVILVLFGVLSKEFNVSPNAILITIPAFMIPFAIVQLFSGAISDVKGRFLVIELGTIIFGMGMLIAAISFSLLVFVIANILGGIGFGLINPVLIALITDITPEEKVSKRIGYLGAVANLAVGLGPLLAGQMLLFGWRYIYITFLFITFFCLISIIIVKSPKKQLREDSGLRFLFSHIYQEIRRPIIIIMMVSALLLSLTYLATIIWTSRAFTGVIDEVVVGIMLALVGVAGSITGLTNGHLIEKKGVGFSLVIGLTLLFSGILLLLLLGDITRTDILVYVTISLIMMGMGSGFLYPTIMYFSQSLSPERRGALAGLITAVTFFGIALIPLVYESLYLYGGITIVYFAIFLMLILLIITLVLLYTLEKKQK